MFCEIDKIIMENRQEIELLQNVVEIAYSSSCITDEEKFVAKRCSELLEVMLMNFDK